MKASVVVEFGKPWVLRDLPDPAPAAGQVLIRIRACGMCGAEVHIHHGHFPLKTPFVAGHEPVGEIVALGAGIAALRVGDRVGVCWTQRGCGRCGHCQSGRPLYCASAQTWMTMGGGFAELMLAWAEGCTLIPEALGYEAAAPIFCAGYTVVSGLRNAEPGPGDRVAVLGIGGLGHLALQYTAAMGYEAVAVTGSADKVDEAKRFGATEVVVARDRVGEALAKAGGADVIISTTNSAAQVSQAIAGLRPEGRLVSIGALDGPIQLDSMSMLLRQVRVIGSTQNWRADLVQALDLAASGKVTAAVELFPLARLNEARDRLEAGKMRYRAVVLPG